ncbi:hypothetical protein U9M48_002064 [Paspalum notatum var. saurae]|uniref:EGF-like domain-containing protein n=1 Tax=Paspalum notatum var. saurae TaxID=547442 RepID=A0AAQ3SH67_PASNO
MEERAASASARPLLALASLCAAAAFSLPPPPHGAAADGGGGGACGEVQCGMGTCAESGEYQFGFACQCSAGWSRYHVGATQFPFLPCVIPNCTINYSCNDGPSSPTPAPSPPAAAAAAATDQPLPCLMQYCGDGGACEKASGFTHRCACRDGYANLLNDTSYPCYQQCSLGSDCKGLGIGVVNGSAPGSSPPTPISITVKSGAGGTAAQADRLLLLLLLITFSGLQAT